MSKFDAPKTDSYASCEVHLLYLDTRSGYTADSIDYLFNKKKANFTIMNNIFNNMNFVQKQRKGLGST